MTTKKKIGLGTVLVAGLVLWTLSRRAEAAPARPTKPMFGAGPLSPEEIEIIMRERESHVLSPEVEGEIRQNFIEIMASPIVDYLDAVSPTYIEGNNTINVQGINWRSNLHGWKAAIYDATRQPADIRWLESGHPEDYYNAQANSWIWEVAESVSPRGEDMISGTPITGAGLDKIVRFQLPKGVIKSHIRISGAIGDMGAIIAQSGAFDVYDGMTVVYDDAARVFLL